MADAIQSVSKDLKNLGLKVTGPRIRILELFMRESDNSGRHLSAEDVYRMLVADKVDIGLATVYRVLTQFEQAGILVRHHLGKDQATFELDDKEHHDHIVCTRCGRVEEFVDEEIERRQNLIAGKYGFQLGGHSMSLYGICAQCLKKEKTKL